MVMRKITLVSIIRVWGILLIVGFLPMIVNNYWQINHNEYYTMEIFRYTERLYIWPLIIYIPLLFISEVFNIIILKLRKKVEENVEQNINVDSA